MEEEVHGIGFGVLLTERYAAQAERWPTSGRHILAQADSESIIVYQAYPPAIGSYAAQCGRFGGEFSYSRMSWIKPGFLWMMYRSGWGTKPRQEVTLAIRLRRSCFDQLLGEAVPSTYEGTAYVDYEAWQQGVHRSPVRVQWDPDRNPQGSPLQRRAIQLGLRGHALEAYGRRETIEIVDISTFVAEQRQNADRQRLRDLFTPLEAVYTPEDPVVYSRLGVSRDTGHRPSGSQLQA